ncbi:hypothetical protein QUF99_17055 [Bacillus sp. DX4.1]|uniref:hypothetical protein n=1 Tax=Bacillus sp. DX4.1 TaxID=3055867 RepID=UPI00259FEEE3|nr:hypothetical protein [Bacillus sp. DX4.1]MDM5188964.1 hypothetical protein [Bacillus sp. DX4.1]
MNQLLQQAINLRNEKKYEESMKLLIDTAVKLETAKEYERAILFYKDHLNETFK